jgi:hypothetical protein
MPNAIKNMLKKKKNTVIAWCTTHRQGMSNKVIGKLLFPRRSLFLGCQQHRAAR